MAWLKIDEAIPRFVNDSNVLLDKGDSGFLDSGE
jgi:hypothetical protein